MAVTRIWPIRGYARDVLNYIRNPEKTDMDLQNVLRYAVEGEKTERGIFISGINCDANEAVSQFQLVKRQFGKEDGITAYHAYQSFDKGEVTPEIAHQVGKAFAERVWGSRYQVVVATHLDSNCLHNHFVVNSVSFINGKRCREKQWRELAKISDEICKAFSLSVIENPKGKRVPLPIYKMEQNGAPTRCNLAKEAFDEALSRSRNLPELAANLKKQGYVFRYEKNRKYWTIQQKNWKRPIRLVRMGEGYSNKEILERLRSIAAQARLMPVDTSQKRRVLQAKRPLRKMRGLRGLYLHYCYLLGKFPKKQQSRRYVHYLYRDDLLKLKNITDETRFLCRNQVETKAQLLLLRDEIMQRIDKLSEKRDEYRICIRRKDCSVRTENSIKAEIAKMTTELRSLRRQLHLCDEIQKRSEGIRVRMQEACREVKRKERRLER